MSHSSYLPCWFLLLLSLVDQHYKYKDLETLP
jgi:hypothetical protein